MNPAQCYAASVYPEMYGAKEPPRQQTRAKFHFTEFVRPDCYWPQPYSLEQAFQVYRWLEKTAEPFSLHGKYGAYDTLIGLGVMGSTTLHHNPIRGPVWALCGGGIRSAVPMPKVFLAGLCGGQDPRPSRAGQVEGTAAVPASARTTEAQPRTIPRTKEGNR